MVSKYLLLVLFASFAYGQETSALKGWLLGWATDPNLPLLKYGNKSYYMGVNYKASFLQAMQFCDISYMKLLTIDSKEENDFIRKIILDAKQGNEYWTSGSKVLDDKNWIWMSNGKSVEYTNWNILEPNSIAEKCIQVGNYGDDLLWNDLNCDTRINFICQRENSNGGDVLEDKSTVSISPNINILQANGKSYYFTRGFNGNFLQAAFFCRMLHMTLATINSEQENLGIQNYIRDTNLGQRWWIAGTRILDDVWTWFTTGQHVEYTNWQKGQPDNFLNNEKCVSLWFTKQDGLLWNDFNCNEQMSFICERQETVADTRVKREVSGGSSKDQVKSALSLNSQKNAKRYHIETYLEGTQDQAAKFCENYGLELFSIETKEENDILIKTIADSNQHGPFWTSGKYDQGKLKWINDKPVNYENWNPLKTSNFAKNCVQVLKSGQWEPANCNYKRSFICEPKEITARDLPKPIKKCNIQPVVNVYINNNLVKEGVSRIPELDRNTLKEKHTVHITNKLTSCKKN